MSEVRELPAQISETLATTSSRTDVEPPRSRNVHDYFPFPSMRAAQARALSAWEKVISRDKHYAVYEMPTGSGKCLGPGTPILMFDGTIRAVETIKAGEQVMGPDSKPRTVLELSSGRDEMYRVIPTKGMPYDVNSTHVLALRVALPHECVVIPSREGFHPVLNLPMGDYLKRPSYWGRHTKGWRVLPDPHHQEGVITLVGVEVEPIGVGDYHGFSVDGDHLFLLGDFTVVHNSGISYATGAWAASEEIPGYQPGAYLLTTQKSLQAQYLRDFDSRGMVELKGAANYRCGTHNVDCATGGILNRTNKRLIEAKEGDLPFDEMEAFRSKHPTGCKVCPYKIAKSRFMSERLGVTNFSYMLSEVQHVHALRPRNLLIIDEAHNTESQILNFVEIEITAQRAAQVGAENPPHIHVGDVPAARAYVLDSFRPKLLSTITNLEIEIETTDDRTVRDRLTGRLNALEQFASRLGLLSDEDRLGEWFAHTDERTGTLKLRPLTAKDIAQDMLFKMGHRLLFLSATILDGKAFVRGLGLAGSAGGFLRTDSDFPIANRLIHYTPCGSMTFKNVEATLPTLLRKIEQILNTRPDVKGIIHAQSYKLAKSISDYLAGTKHRSRILTHDTSPGSRDAALFQHHHSEEPTILLSPSMAEGLDLSEDLSRICIVPKMPWPFLGDPFVKARMDYDPEWYSWAAALALVQMTGRSVRSDTDFAETFILDSSFDNFMARSGDILPKWWTDSVVYR